VKVPAAALRALARELAGTVVLRTDADYEPARLEPTWNRATVERRPDAIVRVAHAVDVARAVRFAREVGCRVAVRSGGHGWCAAPLRDDGLLLDLGALAGVEVDAAARVASVGPAATNRDLARALVPHGLAFPYGHCGGVALGGYVLGGGVGWNGRAFGAASDHLRALDVVLADGTPARVDADAHPDLWWAARGAGPGFCAVATRLHVDLRALPRAIASSTCVWRLADAAKVAAWLERVTPALDPCVELTLVLGPSPDPVERDAGSGRVAVLSATAFAGDATEAARLLAFVESCPSLGGALDRRLVAPVSFDALFDGIDATFTRGDRWTVDDAWSSAPLADVVACLTERLAVAPSRRSFFLCAVRPLPERRAEGAFSRASDVLVLCYARCAEAGGEPADRAWRDATLAALRPLTAGHYLNESDLAAHPERAAASFSDACWLRLAEVRRRWDPEARFHGFFD